MESQSWRWNVSLFVNLKELNIAVPRKTFLYAISEHLNLRFEFDRRKTHILHHFSDRRGVGSDENFALQQGLNQRHEHFPRSCPTHALDEVVAEHLCKQKNTCLSF